MIDLPHLYAVARRRRARLAVEATLEDAGRTAVEEGLAGVVEASDRFGVLLSWADGTVDGAVLDSRETEEGSYGWAVLLDGRLVLVAPAAALAGAARALARLGAEPRAAALLGADVAAAAAAGLVGRAHGGGRLAADVNLAYGPPGGEADAVNEILWTGGQPVATVRLDGDRPLVAATGEPVEAIALAAALVPR